MWALQKALQKKNEKEFECSKEGPRENIGFAADRSHHQQYEKELATAAG